MSRRIPNPPPPEGYVRPACPPPPPPAFPNMRLPNEVHVYLEHRTAGQVDAELLIHKAPKTRLIMKRLDDVVPGDIMVGRQKWHQLQSYRKIVGVRPSAMCPGKLTLIYALAGNGMQVGAIRRWPDFYVIVVKK